MQNQTINSFSVLAVPSELLEEAGIDPTSVLQYSVEGRKLIVEALDEEGDFVCNGECSDCPFSDKRGELYEKYSERTKEQ